jgi:hypothetical protein
VSNRDRIDDADYPSRESRLAGEAEPTSARSFAILVLPDGSRASIRRLTKSKTIVSFTVAKVPRLSPSILSRILRRLPSAS